MKRGGNMKNIKEFINIKIELNLINLRLEALQEKEEQLRKEKESLEKLSNKLETILVQIEEKLKELKGIEKELLYEILVNGLNVTKAVDKIAFKYDMDSSNIWKNYYPKIKEDIKKIENAVKSSEILV